MVSFLGHNIEKGKIIPINRCIEFASKFPDKVIDITQLQRFLGSLNYISSFHRDLVKDTTILYDRLKKKLVPWTDVHTQAVQRIKEKVKSFQTGKKFIETDASDIGYRGVLKQINTNTKEVYLVIFHSGNFSWYDSQKIYAIIVKEIMAIVKCVLEFQDDLYNQQFTVITDWQSAKFMLTKIVNMMCLSKCLLHGKLI
uniref:Reverse transcriptase RNase H-like domain-containing protein n=1 Tax=Lactuca sativa TaxID=4236 RepID=A0A9R1USD5_LACSA|nr:hypothetical protein LSAT_V11C800445890 [Lactuca sativa]